MMKIIVSVMYWSLQCQQILMWGIVDLVKKLSNDFQNVSSNMYAELCRLRIQYFYFVLLFCDVSFKFIKMYSMSFIRMISFCVEHNLSLIYSIT